MPMQEADSAAARKTLDLKNFFIDHHLLFALYISFTVWAGFFQQEKIFSVRKA
ncbi:MAG: hypothetical protein NC121_20720 [Blautia sp.]|nr:hypothetical protein [Blautia sp.]